MNSLDQMKKEEERWRQECLGRKPVPEEKSASGIPLKVIYTPLDTHPIDFLEKIGFSGEYPFTRGVYPTMYRGNLWTMRQYAGFATPEETNRRYKNLLAQGQPGLSVAFDLPTQCGYDSDDPLIEEEVGKVGVAVDTLQDMEIIFDGIPLDKITTSFTINPTAAIILAMYIAVAEKQGVPVEKIGGTLQNDILKEYLARGTQIFPPPPFPPADRRHHRILQRPRPQNEHHQHLGLPRARGRGQRHSGGRLLPLQRRGLCGGSFEAGHRHR